VHDADEHLLGIRPATAGGSSFKISRNGEAAGGQISARKTLRSIGALPKDSATTYLMTPDDDGVWTMRLNGARR
jgi:hypothetical protein